MNTKPLSVLCIGNSFAADTLQHIPNIAADLGLTEFYFGNLYIGGCSINRHYANALNDTAEYCYHTNSGEGWSTAPDVSIAQAIESRQWDWISIQHGTGDGSRYTREESYVNLEKLIAWVKEKAGPHTRIAFNMAWVMEPYSKHPEIRAYEGDQLKMYGNLVRLTEKTVLPAQGLDKVSPAGTAIQNARNTVLAGKLSRDGFHLSFMLGRYIAGLTFLKALTGLDINGVRWMPEEVSAEEREIAIACANAAVESPFAVTPDII